MSAPARSSDARAARRALRALARDAGVQLAYDDATGQRRVASTDALLAVLRALGLSLNRPDDAPDAHARLLEARRQRAVPVNTVAWNGRTARMRLHADPSDLSDHLSARVELSGAQGAIDLTPTRIEPIESPARQAAGMDVRWRPAKTIPFGLHPLTVRIGGTERHARLISAPSRCYEPPEPEHSVGTFLPLYALHSDESLPAGDLNDLSALADCMVDAGVHYIGTLPLLACFLDDHFNASPYAPVSRLFWNELYVDIKGASEFGRCSEAQRLLASTGTQELLDTARHEGLVEYRRAARLKHGLIDALAATAFNEQTSRARIDEFMRDHPGARDYANYRAAVHEFRGPWQRWSPDQRRCVRSGDWSDNPHWRRHLYSQWLFTRQLGSLTTGLAERGAGLYLDLPVGVNDDGYDRWRFGEQFAEHIDVGAPPDPFFTHGQNWGFSPLHPEHSAAHQHEYFAATLDAHCRYASMLRIDHVMALHRLFWIPRGMDATEGVYVRYPRDELYAILSLASHRHHCRIVGENLGTVPRAITKYMKRRGALSMSVAQFELDDDPDTAVPRPGGHSLAALNTHDMPTFAAFWQGDDIDRRVDFNLLTPDAASEERDHRRRLRRAVARWLQDREYTIDEDAPTAQAMRAVTLALARSDASVLMINLEDLWLEPEPQNVPGVPEDLYPSWRRKASRSLEVICGDEHVIEFIQRICRIRPLTAASPSASDCTVRTAAP